MGNQVDVTSHSLLQELLYPYRDKQLLQALGYRMLPAISNGPMTHRILCTTELMWT